MPSKAKLLFHGLDIVTAIFNPSEQNADILIGYLFPKLDAGELQKHVIMWDKYLHDEHATEEQKQRWYAECDPVPHLFTGFDISKYGNQPRVILAKWWPYISDILLHPSTRLYPILSRDAPVKKILSTIEGQEYLKFLAQRDYEFFYNYIKFFPRVHVDPAIVGKDAATKKEIVEKIKVSGKRVCGGKIKYGKVRRENVTLWMYYCVRCGQPFSEDSVRTYTTKIAKE